MARIGRPAMKAKERSSILIALRLRPDEHKTVEEAAKRAKISVSKYIRTKLGLRGDK
jgi:predicted HicB family RNase H-like nuclease